MRSKVCPTSGGCSRHRIDVPPTVFRYERASCSSPNNASPVRGEGGFPILTALGFQLSTGSAPSANCETVIDTPEPASPTRSTAVSPIGSSVTVQPTCSSFSRRSAQSI